MLTSPRSVEARHMALLLVGVQEAVVAGSRGLEMEPSLLRRRMSHRFNVEKSIEGWFEAKSLSGS
jgi:hypothetical protein